MYRNLEDVFVEQDSPRKSKSTSSTSFNSKATALSKYYEELNYYEPFCHEENDNSEKTKYQGKEGKIKFKILDINSEDIPENEENLQQYEEVVDLFSYNV